MSRRIDTFRWAVAGTGRIASDFASQLTAIEGASVHAVFSRSLDNAERFRSVFGATSSHDSFESMLEDESLQAVYIALPAALHHEYAMKAIRAGKAVLCEKPFALDVGQAADIVRAAGEMGVFCMEAMWMRFSPVINRLRMLTERGDLGTIRSVDVQVGYATSAARLDSADHGRGALLNFGVYGISLAQMLLGEPDAVRADFIRRDDGLDESCSVTLRYADQLATVSASVGLTLSNEAVVTGTRGRAHIAAPFFSPGHASVTRFDEPQRSDEQASAPVKGLPLIDRIPLLGLAQGSFLLSLVRGRGRLLLRGRRENGLRLEAMELMQCVGDGQVESEVMPHADTLAVARILDRAREAQPD